MEQFAAVAVAHFLALLVPGVDFMLIARTTLTAGRRDGVGVCLGVTTANAVFVTAAFAGVTVFSQPGPLLAVKAAGGVFLVYVGVVLVRSGAHVDLGPTAPAAPFGALRAYALGLTSGLLNPKNALFYVSLAAASPVGPSTRFGYGVWMVAVVLGWDTLVVVVLGADGTRARLARVLPLAARAAGASIVVLGAAMVVDVAARGGA